VPFGTFKLILVSLIAAMDRCGLIGDEAGLPWHLPKDLRRFRAYIWGKPINAKRVPSGWPKIAERASQTGA
jgi:hypothetical protein